MKKSTVKLLKHSLFLFIVGFIFCYCSVKSSYVDSSKDSSSFKLLGLLLAGPLVRSIVPKLDSRAFQGALHKDILASLLKPLQGSLGDISFLGVRNYLVDSNGKKVDPSSPDTCGLKEFYEHVIDLLCNENSPKRENTSGDHSGPKVTVNGVTPGTIFHTTLSFDYRKETYLPDLMDSSASESSCDNKKDNLDKLELINSKIDPKRKLEIDIISLNWSVIRGNTLSLTLHYKLNDDGVDERNSLTLATEDAAHIQLSRIPLTFLPSRYRDEILSTVGGTTYVPIKGCDDYTAKHYNATKGSNKTIFKEEEFSQEVRDYVNNVLEVDELRKKMLKHKITVGNLVGSARITPEGKFDWIFTPKETNECVNTPWVTQNIRYIELDFF